MQDQLCSNLQNILDAASIDFRGYTAHTFPLPDVSAESTGPYIGQCPLHLEVSKQPGGSAKIYLILNSLNSPYLLHHTPAKPAQSAPAGVSLSGTGGCDEFCQALKKAFDARVTNFAGAPRAKLLGAKGCLVKKVSATTDAGAEFVCYWQEVSPSAGEARFRDLVAHLQVLVPSDWSSHQENELDEQTGAALIAWHADEPGAKQDAAPIFPLLQSPFTSLHGNKESSAHAARARLFLSEQFHLLQRSHMAKLKDKTQTQWLWGGKARLAATNCRPSSERKSPVGLRRRDGRVNGHTTRKTECKTRAREIEKSRFGVLHLKPSHVSFYRPNWADYIAAIPFPIALKSCEFVL